MNRRAAVVALVVFGGACTEVTDLGEGISRQKSEVGYLDTYYGYFESDPDGWQPDSLHYGYDDDIGSCPKVFRHRERQAWLTINNVGMKKFYFRGPFEWIGPAPYPNQNRTDMGLYRSYDGIGEENQVDQQGGKWLAEGPVVILCKRIGRLSGTHVMVSVIVGFEGTFKYMSGSLGMVTGTSGGGSMTCEFGGNWHPDTGCPTNGTGGGGGGGGVTYWVKVCGPWVGPEDMGVTCEWVPEYAH